MRTRFQLALGHARLQTAGAGDASTQAFALSLESARRGGDREAEARALWAGFTDAALRGRSHDASVAAAAFDALIDDAAATPLTLTRDRLHAQAALMRGDLASATRHATAARQVDAGLMHFLAGSGCHVDHRSATLTTLARLHWLQGRPDEAMRLADEAVRTARQQRFVFALGHALAYAACPIALWCGDLAAAAGHAEQLQTLAQRHSLAYWIAWARTWQALVALRARGDEGAPDRGLLPRELLESLRQPAHADQLATLDASLLTDATIERARSGDNGWCAPEILRLDADRSWRAGRCDASEAQQRLQHARRLAREAGLRAWELRIACSLVQVGRALGDGAAATDELARVLACFDEGRGTPDLLAANALLATR